jgi:hypothetical protein
MTNEKETEVKKGTVKIYDGDTVRDARHLTDEEQKKIMDTIRYRQKEGTMLTIEDEVNFLSGVGTALWEQNIIIPVPWLFRTMGGRSIIKDYEYPYVLVEKDGKVRMLKNKRAKG